MEKLRIVRLNEYDEAQLLAAKIIGGDDRSPEGENDDLTELLANAGTKKDVQDATTSHHQGVPYELAPLKVVYESPLGPKNFT